MTAPPAQAEFSSRRAIAPMLWALFCIALAELVVVHALIAFWSARVALVVSFATVPAIVWLAFAIASLSSQPSRIMGDMLDLRAGRLRGVRVPLATVARIRGVGDAMEVKRAGVLNLAMIAFPNVLLELATPVEHRGRLYDAVAHRVDDPGGLVAALERAEARLLRDG